MKIAVIETMTADEIADAKFYAGYPTNVDLNDEIAVLESGKRYMFAGNAFRRKSYNLMFAAISNKYLPDGPGTIKLIIEK